MVNLLVYFLPFFFLCGGVCVFKQSSKHLGYTLNSAFFTHYDILLFPCDDLASVSIVSIDFR